jgi:quercetin dioxygenase-like cupin family protein
VIYAAATVQPHQVTHPDWQTLDRPGCVGVSVKLLLRKSGLNVAILKFDEHATIDEHRGAQDAVVFCLEGEGNVSLADERWVLREGDWFEWPHGERHRLWTEAHTMVTLMLETPPLRA